MWFWKQEESKDEDESDLSIRVAEIRSRIASLRSSLERAEKSNKSTPTQPEPVVEPSQPTDNTNAIQREQELRDLKAKLLSRSSTK
jgi:hypothetical protein